MAIIISPSQKIEDLLNPRYAQVGDEVEVTFVNDLPTLTLPYSSPTPPPYSCRALVNTTGVTDLSGAWANCAEITEFPLLEFDDCLNFEGAWQGCAALTTFPAHAFDNCPATEFGAAWYNCALSQQSVDNILISIDTAGQLNGTLGINGGTSSPPGPAGAAAKASLVSRGWTVTTN